MTVLTFVMSVSLALFLAIFALAMSRRRGRSVAGADSPAWLSDGGSSHTDSGAGSDCGASDGGGCCDGGGGGDGRKPG
jgi:hypothetical protein